MEDSISLKKRLTELYNRSNDQYRYVYTDFLSQSELSVFMELGLPKDCYFVNGGYEMAERCMIGFGNKENLGYEIDFPMVLLLIEPVMKKFADKLTHRDFLGALMNLGITREKLGDIIICDNSAYIFCTEQIAEYIIDSLSYVKHTHIRLKKCDSLPESVGPKLQDKDIIVASNRADAIIAKLFNLSREQALLLFREKKIFVNSRSFENNSGSLKEGDIVSVRGFGKFIFAHEGGMTKKDRLYVSVKIYI